MGASRAAKRRHRTVKKLNLQGVDPGGRADKVSSDYLKNIVRPQGRKKKRNK